MAKNWMRLMFAMVLAAGLSFGMGCEEEPNVGDKIEDAAEDAGDAVGDAVEDAGDAIKDATN